MAVKVNRDEYIDKEFHRIMCLSGDREASKKVEDILSTCWNVEDKYIRTLDERFRAAASAYELIGEDGFSWCVDIIVDDEKRKSLVECADDFIKNQIPEDIQTMVDEATERVNNMPRSYTSDCISEDDTKYLIKAHITEHATSKIHNKMEAMFPLIDSECVARYIEGLEDITADKSGYPILKVLMRNYNITADAVAELIGVTRNTVYDRVNGKHGQFTYLEMCKIHHHFGFGKYLGVPINKLFGLTDDDMAHAAKAMDDAVHVFTYLSENSK